MYQKDSSPSGGLDRKDYPCDVLPNLDRGCSSNGDFPACNCPTGKCPCSKCSCSLTKGGGCRTSGRLSGRASSKTQRPGK